MAMKPNERRETLDIAEADLERMRNACLEPGAKSPDAWTVLRSIERLLVVVRAHEEELR